MKITDHDNAILMRAARVMQKILGRIEMAEYKCLYLAAGRKWAEIDPVGWTERLQSCSEPNAKPGRKVIRAHDKKLKKFFRVKKYGI